MEISKIMTCDQEWSHEELYGVAYDECIHACKNIKFLLDMDNLDKPNILMEVLMNELDEGMNLVDYYDRFYVQKTPYESSNDVFAKWDQWMQARIQATLQAHKSKHYINK